MVGKQKREELTIKGRKENDINVVLRRIALGAHD